MYHGSTKKESYFCWLEQSMDGKGFDEYNTRNFGELCKLEITWFQIAMNKNQLNALDTIEGHEIIMKQLKVA